VGKVWRAPAASVVAVVSTSDMAGCWGGSRGEGGVVRSEWRRADLRRKERTNPRRDLEARVSRTFHYLMFSLILWFQHVARGRNTGLGKRQKWDGARAPGPGHTILATRAVCAPR